MNAPRPRRRAMPPPPPHMPCTCSGRFGLDYDEAGVPTAYHSLPYCPEFEAIETTIDAIEHFERCRAAKKPS